MVVVGDSKQLPPTSFFDSLVAADDAEPEDEATAASDIESVLGPILLPRARISACFAGIIAAGTNR